MPSIFANRAFVEAGGLLSYGPDVLDNYRLAATYDDQIPRREEHAGHVAMQSQLSPRGTLNAEHNAPA